VISNTSKVDYCLDKWCANFNGLELSTHSLDNWDFCGWVPTVNRILFRNFNPNHFINDDLKDLEPPINSHFSFQDTKAKCNKNVKRKMCSYNFFALNDSPNRDKKDPYQAEYRFFFIAQTTDDNCLRGFLLLSNTSSQKITDAESELYVATEDCAKFNYAQALFEGKSFPELHDVSISMNKKYVTLEETYNKFMNEHIGKESDVYGLFPFAFSLDRYGFLLVKDLLDEKKRNNIYYENHDELRNNYTFVTRVYKMVYYYIKQSFHTHANHNPFSDSMIGVFNNVRVQKVNSDYDKWIIFYECQQTYLLKAIEDIKEDKILNKVSPIGIAIYGRALLNSLNLKIIDIKTTVDQLNNWSLYEKKEKNLWENTKKNVEQYLHQNSLPGSIYFNIKLISIFIWLVPYYLLLINFYNVFIKGSENSLDLAVKTYPITMISLTMSLYIILLAAMLKIIKKNTSYIAQTTSSSLDKNFHRKMLACPCYQTYYRAIYRSYGKRPLSKITWLLNILSLLLVILILLIYNETEYLNILLNYL